MVNSYSIVMVMDQRHDITDLCYGYIVFLTPIFVAPPLAAYVM